MSFQFKQVKVEPGCGSVGVVVPKPSVNLEPGGGVGPNPSIELPRMGNKSRRPQAGTLLKATTGCSIPEYGCSPCEECGKSLTVHMKTNLIGHHSKCCKEVSKKVHQQKEIELLAKDTQLHEKDIEIGKLREEIRILRIQLGLGTEDSELLPKETRIVSPGESEDILSTFENGEVRPSTSQSSRNEGFGQQL